MGNPDRKDFEKLRQSFDGRDTFMRGSSISGIPRSSHANRLQRTPAWVNNDLEVQKLLKRAFPKLETDPKQRARAGTWQRILHLYYRVGHSSGRIAMEMHIPVQRVQSTLYRIRKVRAGLRTDGKRRAAKRGRPTRPLVFS